MSAPKFTFEEAQAAAADWGLNCGPGAVAAVFGLTLEELRPHLGDFERKRYTNPTLMWSILNSLGATWRLVKRTKAWPRYGLVRIQWYGPWTEPGVPMRARYRHTHWIGARWTGVDTEIFDINCMSVGGWVSRSVWTDQVVPWLLKECEPKADGRWGLTHVVEVACPHDR